MKMTPGGYVSFEVEVGFQRIMRSSVRNIEALFYMYVTFSVVE